VVAGLGAGIEYSGTDLFNWAFITVAVRRIAVRNSRRFIELKF